MDNGSPLLTLFTTTALLLLLYSASLPLLVHSSPHYSSKLVHGYSKEAMSFWRSKHNVSVSWPELDSSDHFQLLLNRDVKRQRLKLGLPNRVLVPSQGGRSYNYGNQLGWLHYTWIDIGTPNVSFLVALDPGSDMLWVPCDCIQCAPLSSSHYDILDKDLNEYSPSKSRTSKHLPCSHRLCQQGPNCGSPRDNCPYIVSYRSDNTSSKGFLFEDLLHLSVIDGHANQTEMQASIILGCGTKQSGDYLDDNAPDGLIGLGPGDMSVPSLLAKSGLIPHSFSLCFDKSYSGRISFGDQGHIAQKSTPFIAWNGEYSWYIVGVEAYCFGGSCLKESGFEALVDSGSSFTYLPDEIYNRVVSEFDQQVDTSRFTIQDFPYCYKASSDTIPRFPTMKLMLSSNQSFIIENPTFRIVGEEGVSADCLGIHHAGESNVGVIGQNFMMGYRLVFDMENRRLAWSHSNCQDLGATKLHLSPPPSNTTTSQLPTNQEQLPGGHAVAPAVAGRAPAKPSTGSPLLIISRCRRIFLLLQTIVLLSCTI